jgi:hypothetical protein
MIHLSSGGSAIMRSALRVATLVSASIATNFASAEVTSSAEGGFAVRNEALIAAKSFEVYAALLQIRSWWDPEHTFSGDAHNMSLDAT